MLPLPDSSPNPFSLPGERASALLLHGFTSTPYEVRPVGDALAAAGFAASAPLLPGHGTRPEELNEVTAEDWVRASEAAFEALGDARPRVVVGASMGGLLAVLLARRYPEVRALVLLAPAFIARPIGRLAMGLSPLGYHRVRDMLPKADPGGDIESAEGREKNPCYPSIPLGGLAQLERLRVMATSALEEVRVPVCVLHGAGDRTIDPAASVLVAERVRGPWVERYVLPRSRHVLGLDVEREQLCAIATRFLVEVVTASERAEPARAQAVS